MGGPESQEAELAPGTVLDEKFRIERLLGMGGMGAVYEITHLLTQHRRALKLLHPHYATRKTPVERFFREASAAGHIGHEHIIETFDAGWLSGGEPYLLMELLDGSPLADRLDETAGEGMAFEEVLEIIPQLCEGVQAAHDAGIVHRDLKPENVFLARGGGAWRVKILDFGVSKFDEKLATKLTSGGSFVGTPAYMSPEQFERGADVDARSDVYSLGVILYEMVAGEHPFPATTMMQLARMIMLSEPPPLGDLRAATPRKLEALIAKAMARDPEERVQSAGELALHLRALGDDASHEALHRTQASDPPPAESSPADDSRVRTIESATMDRPMESVPSATVIIESQEEDPPSPVPVASHTLRSAGETDPPPPLLPPRRWLWAVGLLAVVGAAGFAVSLRRSAAPEKLPGRATTPPSPSPSLPPRAAPVATAPGATTSSVPTSTATPTAPAPIVLPPSPRPSPSTEGPAPSPSTERAGEGEWG